MKLYPYQDKNSKEIMELWKIHNSVLYQLPTGGGKTVVINNIIENIIDNKILILVHRQEIIFQIRDRLAQRGITAGVLIGGFEENMDADIIIGSILTVSRDSRLQTILDRDFDYMIIDEAHHACSNSYIKTIKHFKEHNPNYKLLGVTATPYRKDKKPLSKIFDVLIQGPTYPQLREDGYLAGYTCFAAKLDGLQDVDLSGGDFKLSELSKYMRSDWLIAKAIKMYEDKGEDKQMLVFCVDKKHAIQVQKAYENAGHKSIALIDSDTPDDLRKSINKLYREGKLKIIISILTLTEGVDLPNTGVIQLLRPTLSIVIYLQMLGRGTRLKDDKSKLIILDLSNNSYEHGLLDSEFIWNLKNEDPNPNKKINKIGGRKKGGKFTTDVDQIEEEYLEIEEMSHEEYLLQNINGIEIAEKENSDKDKIVESLYKKLGEELNRRCKIPGILFGTSRENLTLYDNWKELKISLNSKELCSIEYSKGVVNMDLGWRNTIPPQEYFKPIHQGKVVDFTSKQKNLLYITKAFIEIEEVLESKVNIRNLQERAEEIEIEKCIFKINELLESGIYKFQLVKEISNSNFSSRNWGSFESLEFIDSPKRLKVNNNIRTFGNRSLEYPNLNKDLVIKVLYKYWYLNNPKID